MTNKLKDKVSSINWNWVLAFICLGVFSLALWSLFHTTQSVQLHDIQVALKNIPTYRLVLALGVVFLGYWVLTLYDWIALRHIKANVAYRRVGITSFTAYAVGHNVGLAVLSAGAIRYRFYSVAGLSPSEITRVILMVSLTFTAGISAISGIVLFSKPQTFTDVIALPNTMVQLIGLGILLLVVGVIVASGKGGRSIRFKQWQFDTPPSRILLLQTLLSILDILVVGLVLYILIPADNNLSYFQVLAAFVQSMVIAILSHVPGGLGVFEAAMLLALPQVPKEVLLAILLVFRIMYYLIPFAIAVLVIIAHEWKQYAQVTERWSQGFSQWLSFILPQSLGVATVLASVVLLFSGATPNDPERETWLGEFIPLPIIEASHLLSSAVGFALLLLARGLFSRLDGAWHLTVWLLVLGIVTSLAKGLDYEEAIVMVIILGLMLKGRKAFYRKASLMTQAFSPNWFLMIVIVLGGSFWLGLFAYKHVEYSDDLWWTFAFDAGGSRFMRASVFLVVLAVGFALYRLLRHSPVAPGLPDSQVLKRAAVIVDKSERANAALVLLGDKYILFSPSGNSFLMYQIQGKSWIAMSDPVGEVSEFEDLLWEFRELADFSGGHVVFYQVTARWLPLYVDMGMGLFKLGEDAIVPLEDFSLEGKKQSDLRQIMNKGQRNHLSFEVISAAGVPQLLPRLKVISDEWLQNKNSREKRFSLGFFDEAYLIRMPCCVVKRDNEIIAFANMWTSANKHEVSLDLMRYVSDSPNGVMEYLFVEMMLWAKANGYQRLNLGMAPLSGMENHRLAPVWHQIGNLMFQHGEYFYNFEGLRHYKEKFNPEWEPRYMAVKGKLYAPRALLDCASIVSGGFKGILSK